MSQETSIRVHLFSHRVLLGITILVLLVGLVPVALSAANEGYVVGTVLDENGEPVTGMSITVQDEGKTAVIAETETDDKGKYRILLQEADLTYAYLLEKKGYAPFEASFAVAAGKESEMNITVLSKEAAKRGAPAMFNEGATAARNGDLAEAEARFKGAIELDPGLAQAHAALGQILLMQERNEEAAEEAQRAMEIEPENAAYLGLLRQALQAMGDKGKAAEIQMAMEQANPKVLASNSFNRGATLFESGSMKEARGAFEQAVAADPDHARGHYMLALCLVNSGEKAVAREHLEKFLELAPEDPDAAGARDMLAYLE
ncbi:MAG: tetratricopeptide repeat protein [Acidobacteriota bacterium]|nr:tetratricopeptide repeat protein [Acidobacteriota bacterium]